MERRPSGRYRGGAFGILSLAAVTLAAALLLFQPHAAAEVIIFAPPDGAVLTTPAITVAGRADGGMVGVTVNGMPVSRLPVKGGRFMASLNLRPGGNRVSFQSQTSRIEVRYDLRSDAAAGAYLFHEPYLEEGCEECHGDWTTVIMSRNSALCHACHDRMDGAKFLHGPVGAGQCTVCHDPHGSANGSLLKVAGRDLCSNCHAQPSSKEHMGNSRNRVCKECHDPHGSGKKFFLR